MTDRALVRNAADPRQVHLAKKREKDERELELADLRGVLESESGRRFLWRLLGHCKTFGTVFDPSDLRMAYGSGCQDVGHFVMSEIAEADAPRLLQMIEESQRRERHQNATTDAHHTATTQERQDARESDQ